MEDTPRTLVLTSRKENGALPVMDGQGRLLARVSASWSGSRFTVTDPDGRRLCLVSARWWGLGPWTVTDADGRSRLSMTTHLVQNRAVIHPDRGGDLVLQGNPWGRGFTVRDADDRCILTTSAEKAAPGGDHADDVVLVQIPDVLRLAQVISVAHIWRMAKKAAIASSTAASSTIARGV